MSDAGARTPPPGPAGEAIRRLNLAPHPEGGWYRETWRAPAPGGGRSGSTAILFLLPAGETSRWHKVDADEIWLWHGGGPLTLAMDGPDGRATVRLGPDVAAGEAFQAVVPAHAWQAARPDGAFALVSCVVAPGFAFDGFTLAPGDWAPPGLEDFLLPEGLGGQSGE